MRSPWRTGAAMAALSVLGSSQAILTTLSKENGAYSYNYATVPLLAEVFKMIVCLAVLCSLQLSGKPPQITWSTSDLLLRFSVPSVIYAALNNVHFAALSYLSPISFQIWSNLKIVTTAILFRLFLNRKLPPQRWCALALLTLGTTLSEVRVGDLKRERNLLSAVLWPPWQGLALVILGAWLSAAAGVYTEFLMKRTDDSMFWQNTQLYICGVFVNALHWGLSAPVQKSGVSLEALVSGYGPVTWLLVVNMAVTGLSVSWIMKFADVIVKVYATSMGMVLTAVLSVLLFRFSLTVELTLGMVVSMASMFLYFQPQRPAKQVLRVD